MKDATKENGSTFLAYMQLCRIPNVFTAAADVLSGFLVARQMFQPVGQLACVVAASCCLYIAGMILNDVYDVDVDTKERPERPIPSGRVSINSARALGYGLLLLGVGLSWAAGYLFGDSAMPWRTGAVGSAIAVCVLLYDAVLKNTALAPFVMGACRALNILLGISCGAAVVNEPAVIGFAQSHCLIAIGMGVYITGVTFFASGEAETSSRMTLGTGVFVMLLGILALALFPSKWNVAIAPLFLSPKMWFLLLGLLAFTIVRRCLMAMHDPQPKMVQLAVKNAILSLIVFNAAIALMVAGPIYGAVVFALVIPAMTLGIWVYST